MANTALDVSKRFIRVLGRRRGLIEFSFAIGDPDVCIDLLLTPPDFRAFCEQQNVHMPGAIDEAASPEPVLPPHQRDAS